MAMYDPSRGLECQDEAISGVEGGLGEGYWVGEGRSDGQRLGFRRWCVDAQLILLQHHRMGDAKALVFSEYG